MSGNHVKRETARSKDGTLVPFSVVMPKGIALDGSRACVAMGYGGYGVNVEPRFRATQAFWLEQGVLYVAANLRGGGELGADWHHQGSLTHKQNVFDDFAAVLKTLVERGYTRADRLGIIGGSNGGLLMGALLTQHPELFHAVVSYVGIYDMLRVELWPNGAFNVEEFGSVRDAAQFEALYAYSPYHHVRSGTGYPAALLITDENDPRVDPMHTRKMTARLQAATAGPGPILLRSNAAAGHGNDTPLDDRIAETVDVLAFMLSQLGVSYQARKQ